MADDRLEEAVDVVARHVVYAGAYSFCESAWDEYPEIGEFDWERVEERVNEIIDNLQPTPELFEAAYKFLEERVDPNAEA